MNVPKPLVWVGSSKRDLKKLPDDVKDSFGFALYLAQIGERAISAKPFKGLSGVVELVENHDGDTYRAMYTARFGGVVYVLHAFQKKSKRGIKTPKQDVDLVRRRLREAEALHAAIEKKEDRK